MSSPSRGRSWDARTRATASKQSSPKPMGQGRARIRRRPNPRQTHPHSTHPPTTHLRRGNGVRGVGRRAKWGEVKRVREAAMCIAAFRTGWWAAWRRRWRGGRGILRFKAPPRSYPPGEPAGRRLGVHSPKVRLYGSRVPRFNKYFPYPHQHSKPSGTTPTSTSTEASMKRQ